LFFSTRKLRNQLFCYNFQNPGGIGPPSDARGCDVAAKRSGAFGVFWGDDHKLISRVGRRDLPFPFLPVPTSRIVLFHHELFRHAQRPLYLHRLRSVLCTAVYLRHQQLHRNGTTSTSLHACLVRRCVFLNQTFHRSAVFIFVLRFYVACLLSFALSAMLYELFLAKVRFYADAIVIVDAIVFSRWLNSFCFIALLVKSIKCNNFFISGSLAKDYSCTCIAEKIYTSEIQLLV